MLLHAAEFQGFVVGCAVVACAVIEPSAVLTADTILITSAAARDGDRCGKGDCESASEPEPMLLHC